MKKQDLQHVLGTLSVMYFLGKPVHSAVGSVGISGE